MLPTVKIIIVLCVVLILNGCGDNSGDQPPHAYEILPLNKLILGDNDENKADIYFSLGCLHCIDTLNNNMSVLKALDDSASVTLIEVPGVINSLKKTNSKQALALSRTASVVTRCAVIQDEVSHYLEAVEYFIETMKKSLTASQWKNWSFAERKHYAPEGEYDDIPFDGGYGLIRRYAAIIGVDYEECLQSDVTNVQSKASVNKMLTELPNRGSVPKIKFHKWESAIKKDDNGLSHPSELWLKLYEVGHNLDDIQLVDVDARNKFIRNLFQQQPEVIISGQPSAHHMMVRRHNEQVRVSIDLSKGEYARLFTRFISKKKKADKATIKKFVKNHLKSFNDQLYISPLKNKQYGTYHVGIELVLNSKEVTNKNKLVTAIEKITKATNILIKQFDGETTYETVKKAAERIHLKKHNPYDNRARKSSTKPNGLKNTSAGSVWSWNPKRKPVDLGPNGLNHNSGLIKRLAPHWLQVKNCKDLTVETNNGNTILVGSVFDDDRNIDMACAMEKVGHRITHIAYVKGKYNNYGVSQSEYFYQVQLADGHRIILNGNISATSNSYQGQKKTNNNYYYLFYRSAISMETGRVYNDNDWSDHKRNATVENRPLAQLLLGAKPDANLLRLGLAGGEAVKPGMRTKPTVKDVSRAVRARINNFYPAKGCFAGFKSHLKVKVGNRPIEVCVNFNNFRDLSCERIQRGADKFRCSVRLTVVPGSSTHPQFNAMFRERAQQTTISDLILYNDRGEYSLDATKTSIQGIVPVEFR